MNAVIKEYVSSCDTINTFGTENNQKDCLISQPVLVKKDIMIPAKRPIKVNGRANAEPVEETVLVLFETVCSRSSFLSWYEYSN